MSSETIPAPPAAPAPEKTIQSRATVQEYFALERTSDVRHEYVDGEILAMAGETPTHNRIARNICVRLENSFEARPCETFIENVRTRVSPTKYRYPDIAALCGEARFDQEKPPSLLNPQVIFEVLPQSTESKGSDDKFSEYWPLDTLADYVLIAQDQVEVMHYSRQSARKFILTFYVDLNDVLSFPALEISFTVADVYRKTVLAAVA